MTESILGSLRFVDSEEGDNDEPEYGRMRYAETGDIVFEPSPADSMIEPCDRQPIGDFEILADEVFGEIPYEEGIASFLTAPRSQRSTRNTFDGSQRNTLDSQQNTFGSQRNTFDSPRSCQSTLRRSCSQRNTFESERETYRSTVRRSRRCSEEVRYERQISENSQGSLHGDSRVVAGAASILRTLAANGRNSQRVGDRPGGSDMSYLDDMTLTEFVHREQHSANAPDVLALQYGADDLSSLGGYSTRVGTTEDFTSPIFTNESLDFSHMWSRNATHDTLHWHVDQEDDVSDTSEMAATPPQNFDRIAEGSSDVAMDETANALADKHGAPVVKTPVGPSSKRPRGKFALQASLAS